MKLTPVEAITAALTGQKAGFTTGEIRECLPPKLRDKVAGTVNRLVKAGALIKHAGESPRTSRYTLNPDHVPARPAAPPPKRKPRAKVQPTPPAAARPAAEARLTPGPLALYYGEGMRCEHWNVATMAALMRELKHGPAPTPFDRTPHRPRGNHERPHD
jgi:hypothetical protein